MKRRHFRCEVIGWGLAIGIVTGIVLDTWIHEWSKPLVYTAEAHTEVVTTGGAGPREVLIEARIDWNEERIDQEIEMVAEKYGVSASEMKRTIRCESGYDTDIQSYHRYTFTDAKRGIYAGERELSFGLAQIHLPHHPTVTKEQANDPKFAIDFMGKNWHTVRWYCR